MSVSRDARLFFIGLWNQCDDQGVFEWKPLGLRMRVFPADPIDAVPLLAELERADLIRAFEIDNRRYGVVRNFVRFQRPKRPRNIHPLQNLLRQFSGLTSKNSPHVPNMGVNVSAEEGGRRESPLVTPLKSKPRHQEKNAAFTTVHKREAH